jgi:CheY-like chemotaxis protein
LLSHPTEKINYLILGPNRPGDGYEHMESFEPLSPAVILVVEDEFLVQLELVDWLDSLGLSALTADNAEAALAVLRARPDIQIMLTDIQMPGVIDGIRLAHHVAERWPAIGILVMSGLHATELSTLPAGSRFFPKPIDHEELWRALACEPRARNASIVPPGRSGTPSLNSWA